MNDKFFFRIADGMIIGLLVGLVISSAMYFTSNEQINGANYTQQLCNASHQVNNGALEKACGNAQDKYNVSFECNRNTCWTEAK